MIFILFYFLIFFLKMAMVWTIKKREEVSSS